MKYQKIINLLDIHQINHLNLGKNWDGINDESWA